MRPGPFEASSLVAASVLMWLGDGGALLAEPARTTAPLDRPPDRELQRTITDRLQRHDALAKRDIKVDVEQGRVTLRGVVASEFEKTHAYFLATVPGVAEIENRLEVRGEDRLDDGELRATIERAFARDPRVAGAGPRVHVQDGVVTLYGTIGSREAKQAAADIVRQFAAVKRVRNHLEVRAEEVGRSVAP